MTDTAPSATAPLHTHLSEMDKLRLQLAKEKAQRIQAQLVNLQMAQQQAQAQFSAIEMANAALFEKLKVDYSLAPADEIGEDGSIKRSPVRSLPAAPPKEG